jgi:hypothetical protein
MQSASLHPVPLALQSATSRTETGSAAEVLLVADRPSDR